jgi:hypothetical protein
MPMTANNPGPPKTYQRAHRTGLTHHDPERACQGYTLYSPLNDTKATFILDMAGNEVHRWDHDSQPGQYGYLQSDGQLFYMAKTAEGGDIFPNFLGFKGGALRRLDWQGNLLWEHIAPLQHHDARSLDNRGAIYLSTEQMSEQEAARVQGGYAEGEVGMWADVVIEVDEAGNHVWEWHAKDHLDPDIDKIMPQTLRWEWSHFNTVVPLSDGRVILSARNLSTVYIVEKSSGEILDRIGDGLFFGQHDPRLLPNGNMLVFDNGVMRHRDASFFNFSRIVEIDLTTREIVWQYQDTPPYYFHSPFISGVEPLPNGNYLVTEGSTGRMFQITREGDVVWEYICPYFAPNARGMTWNNVQKARFYTSEQLPQLR